jgi:hypothetical protein
MKHWHGATAAALCALAALGSGDASAQAADTWQFQGTLYVYLPTIGGTTTFQPPGGGSGVSIDAKTILDNLKMTFMGSLEARKARWGVFTDVVYVDLGNTKSGSHDLSIGGVPLPADVTANLTLDLKGTAWTLAGSYRAVEDPTSPVDVFAGTRLLDMKQKLDWQLSGNLGSIPLPDRSGTQSARLSNWDAIVGVKGRVGLDAERKWFVPYYVDVGTGDSDLTWQAMAGIGYAFGWGEVVGAWRYLDYRMKSGKAVESLNFNGPGIAAVWRW